MTKLMGVLQIIAVTLQGAPEVINLIPAKYHPLLHFAVSVVQAVGWYVQRGYNPDGTPAAVAFEKGK